MANYGPKINWVSHDGPEPAIGINPQDWQKIEHAIGATINEEDRTQLIYICNTYLGLKSAEISVCKGKAK